MALTEGQRLADLNSQQIAELQNLLMRAGYNPGPVDGLLGPQTRAAFGRFLSANKLPFESSDPVIPRLVSDLWSNAVPELWGGIVHGAEMNGTPATTPYAPAPAAQTQAPAPTAPPTGATTVTNSVAAPSTPLPPLGDDAQVQYVKEQYPELSYLLWHPEIGPILRDSAANSWPRERLQVAILETEWWRTTAESARVWDARLAVDPSSATAEWDQRTVSVLNMAQQYGAPVDEAGAKWLAGRVIRENWSDDQLKRFLGSLVRNAGGANPGLITGKQAELKALSRRYLVNMRDADALEYATRIAEGSTSQEAIETMLRNEAKSRFHWLAPQIDSGLSPMDLFGSTRNAIADTLEMDPEQIDLNDPKWSIITAPIQENGKPTRSMNFHEAQTWARNQTEWRYTQNANDSASRTALDLLKALGARA